MKTMLLGALLAFASPRIAGPAPSPQADRAQAGGQVPAPEAPAAAGMPSATARRPAIGQPAPEVGLSVWIGDDPQAPGNVTEKVVRTGADLPTSRKARTLAELTDHVVIVHTFQWAGEPSGKALPLIRDLLAANADRRIAGIGIAEKSAAVSPEAAKGNAGALGLLHPLALEDFASSASPYVDGARHPPCWAFVIGRGGGVLWEGDPSAKEKDFLAATRTALALPAVLPIERELASSLAKALAEYYAGRLSKALDLAEDAAAAAAKAGDEAAGKDAQYLAQRVREAELDWLKRLQDAAAQKDASEYCALVAACRTGFARGEIAKDLERLEKEARKDGFFEMRLLDSEKYLEMLADRPVMFPARKEAAGEKFAKKLESFVRSTPNSTAETRTAKALADRYRLTAR